MKFSRWKCFLFFGESVENFRVKLLLSCEVVGWVCGLMMFGLGYLVANGRFVIGILFDELLGALATSEMQTKFSEVSGLSTHWEFKLKILKLLNRIEFKKLFSSQSLNLGKANFKHS